MFAHLANVVLPPLRRYDLCFCEISLFFGLSWLDGRACEHLASLRMLTLVLTEINLASSTVHSVIKEYIFKLLESKLFT